MRPPNYRPVTTLELARLIADAVAVALLPAGSGKTRSDDNSEDRPTQAVLDMLRQTDSWFCRWQEAEDGTTDDRPFEPDEAELRRRREKQDRIARLSRRGRKM